MQCPVDNTRLVITERQGIEIDYCPTCRGVWLDRGELEKLIDREASYSPPRREERPRQDSYREGRRYDDDDDEYRSHGHHDQKHRGHKKESFLGDLFDF